MNTNTSRITVYGMLCECVICLGVNIERGVGNVIHVYYFLYGSIGVNVTTVLS